jgi:hypothetical protein
MKNADLTLSRRAVNMSWKEDIYSLPEICNWFRNENSDKKKEAELKKFFELVKIPRPSINPAFVRSNCPASHLVNNEIKALVKNKETGKFEVSETKREKFSAWYVQGCIMNAAAKISAAAGSKKEQKKQDPDPVTESAAAAAKAAAAVNANKKRNAAAKAAKAAGKK